MSKITNYAVSSKFYHLISPLEWHVTAKYWRYVLHILCLWPLLLQETQTFMEQLNILTSLSTFYKR